MVIGSKQTLNVQESLSFSDRPFEQQVGMWKRQMGVSDDVGRNNLSGKQVWDWSVVQ